jgi:hypothetical protein
MLFRVSFSTEGKDEKLRPRFESTQWTTRLRGNPSHHRNCGQRDGLVSTTRKILPTFCSKLATMNTMVGFPSGQREQTVNLPSQTSKVRILPPPPSLYVPPTFEIIMSLPCITELGRMRSFDQGSSPRSGQRACAVILPTTISLRTSHI